MKNTNSTQVLTSRLPEEFCHSPEDQLSLLDYFLGLRSHKSPISKFQNTKKNLEHASKFKITLS